MAMKIPGLSYSWKRAIGISGAKQRFARRTGIPTTRSGLQRKIGSIVIKFVIDLITGGNRRL